jgi:Glycosyltransferase family 92
LYDNGSEDELGPTVSRLLGEGYDVVTYYWPWPKTQEAGFSHCAAVNEQSCHWMAFIDVDEFMFSPTWVNSDQPYPSMLASMVQPIGNKIGQISMNCHEFGPSGLKTHLKNGVTRGYTCRRKSMERHKSIVRLKAVDQILINSVHHFKLKDGFKKKRNWHQFI